MGEDLACTLIDGVQPRVSPTEADGVSSRCYECSDGRWIIVMMPFRHDYYWPRFCDALGKPEWAEAEEYNTPSKRGSARVELGAQIQGIISTHDMPFWLEKLEEAGCIAGPIATLPEVCEDPQLRANGAFREVRPAPPHTHTAHF